MKRIFCMWMILSTSAFLIGIAWCDAPLPTDGKKRTTLGKYVTSGEAYERWKVNPGSIKILDVRSREEYVFVGHAPMAINIPFLVMSGKWDSAKKNFPLVENSEFLQEAKIKLNPGDTVLVMCGCGTRSAAAIEKMSKDGFMNLYNVVDGFEGDNVSDPDSVYKGKRMKNGWKNSGAPWTYELSADLVYRPDETNGK